MLPLLPFPLIQPMINIGMLLSRFGLRPFGLVVWSCRLVLSFGLVVPALAGDRVGMDERSPCAVKHRDREGFLTSLGLHCHLQFSLSLVI